MVVPQREIDDAIDRAVREMTALDPAPGFRARVLERLDSRSAGWITWPRLSAAAGLAAAALLLAVTMFRPAPDPGRDQVVAGTPAAAPPTTVAAPPASPERAPDRMAERAGPEPPARRAVRRGGAAETSMAAAVAEIPGPAVHVAPLPAIDPITVAPVEPAPIVTAPEIEIPPIQVASLRIQPLSQPR